MSHDSNLVYMANQIGKFFARQPTDKAVDSIADHLFKYWDPRMRRQIIAYVAEHGGGELSSLGQAAVARLRELDGEPPGT